MPNLKTIRAGIAKLPEGPPLVVALTGATNGIGLYTAKVLADTFAKHGSKLRVYIVGRTASRAEELLKYGRKTSPGSDWRFVQASDLSLMSEVDRISQEIIKQEEANPFAGGPPRLDVLYMSQALSPLQASPQTKEGLDTQLSLLYYSRMRLINSLTPLLTRSPTPSHVISIFAGSMEEAKPGENCIGVPPPGTYGINSVRKHVCYMENFFFEELAERHAGKISFTHIYPGLVDSPVFYSDVNPLWFRVAWRVLKPLVSWYVTSDRDCGAVMVFLATGRYPAKGTKVGEGVVGGVAYSTLREQGGGCYAVGQRGDENKNVAFQKLRKGDEGRKVWEHTIEVFEGLRGRTRRHIDS